MFYNKKKKENSGNSIFLYLYIVSSLMEWKQAFVKKQKTQIQQQLQMEDATCVITYLKQK